MKIYASSKETGMNNIHLQFADINYTLPMIFVEGTKDKMFLFGTENDKKEITLKDFFISAIPVTQILWEHIMVNNLSHFKDPDRPVEYVSYNDIVNEHGFLEKINASDIRKQINKQFQKSLLQFRLPSETEWEYAARGGIHWKDNFLHSGSNNIDEVAWYKDNSQNETKPVAQKKPNQLGIYDMNGNVWEWCEDYFTRDTNKIPKDGTPYLEGRTDRVLRGGCFHNWDIHCTVFKRYEIIPEHKDECVGFRLVLAFN